MNINQRQVLDLIYWGFILALGGSIVVFAQTNQDICLILVFVFLIFLILMYINWKKAMKTIKKEKQDKG